MLKEPKFLSSPYFYTTPAPDPETKSHWNLKPGAPPEIQKSYEEWRKSEIEAAKLGIDL
jgi:hypothetical protein